MSPFAAVLFALAVLAASFAGERLRARIPQDAALRRLVLAVSLALFAAAFAAGFGSPLSLALVVIMAFLVSAAGVFSGPWGRS